MSTKIVTSAPGKVILFGEHAVVLGKMAVATALSLRTFATFTLESESNPKLLIKLPDLSAEYEWLINDSFKEILQHPFVKENHQEATFDQDFFNSIPLPELLEMGSKIATANPNASKAIGAFLYLYFATARKQATNGIFEIKESLTVEVKSFLPVGMGLGSSAAFCVAVAAGLLQLFKIEKPIDKNQDVQQFSTSEKKLINDWAFQGEKITHGTPSGVDNTVSSFGGTITLVKKDQMIIDHIENAPPLRFLLTNTQVPRNTSELVRGVREYHQREPEVVNPMLDEIDSISRRCVQLFKESDSTDFNSTMETLIDRNHQLLNKLGVGHESLDRVCQTTLKEGFHSKLTGAGGGGCALTFLAEGSQAQTLAVIAHLEKEGFQCFPAEIGCMGASLHNNV